MIRCPYVDCGKAFEFDPYPKKARGSVLWWLLLRSWIAIPIGIVALAVYTKPLAPTTSSPDGSPNSSARTIAPGAEDPKSPFSPDFVRSSTSPVAWRVGTIDHRFKIDATEAKEACVKATKLWEKAAGHDLFFFDAENGIPVDFVYDDRQKKVDSMVEALARLVSLRAQLKPLARRLDRSEKEYQRRVKEVKKFDAMHEEDVGTFNRTVQSWNESGSRIPEDVVDRLEETKAKLKDDDSLLTSAYRELEQLRQGVNRTVNVHNAKLREIEEARGAFASVSGGDGTDIVAECFREGSNATHISVYAFIDEEELAVTLAHEFGHSLGIEHVDSKDALMAAVSSDKGRFRLKLTQPDIDALNALGR